MDLQLQGISNLHDERDCHFSSIFSSPGSSTSEKKRRNYKFHCLFVIAGNKLKYFVCFNYLSKIPVQYIAYT